MSEKSTLPSGIKAFERKSSAGVLISPGKDDDKIFHERGVLFLNEFPIDAASYAARRADNANEEYVWNRHLEALNVTAASPGLLYLQKGNDTGISIPSLLELSVCRVPKTSRGSVWTPANLDAISFTQSVSQNTFGWP